MAGEIRHVWHGTVLTIVSDSGTSSMDLKGDTGNAGCRGPQGPAGIIIGENGQIDWNGYATEQWVKDEISGVQTDLSDYYTKTETVNVMQQSLNGYALKSDVPNLDGYATQSYVMNAVSNVQVDLNGYATEAYVQDQMANIDIDGYATEDYVTTAIAMAQLEGAGVDTSTLATKEYVANNSIGKSGRGVFGEIFNDYKNNKADGTYSHAEGNQTKAYANYAHAEGVYTVARGSQSHAEGKGTVAEYASQHVQGEYNRTDYSPTTSGTIITRGRYAHIVGNGTADNARSNAMTLDWEGNVWFAGNVYVGGTSMDDATMLGTGSGSGGGLTESEVNALIDAKLGVIENGSY